jgi:hypothetical protein
MHITHLSKIQLASRANSCRSVATVCGQERARMCVRAPVGARSFFQVFADTRATTR